ncbi:conserved hypothetical protein [Culex quinquefasciatus]|uniref:Uncharacterized protein n=1 Tax=Culex quinquefasciatus TaxID=7176 RepID=B0W6A2_CULQU|nr:conserved hypothetical protein [Culex quinquefasciatus]|eukprot:XP_001844236.1 conserved hypothetical protein [Culex quinquefasciatus]
MEENFCRVSKNEISSLMKEQRQLKATETKLKSMIDKINNHLNQLLVEELQLKSRELGQDLATTSTSMSQMKLDAAVTSEQINKQELDLNVQHSTLLKSLSLEESEEDDE